MIDSMSLTPAPPANGTGLHRAGWVVKDPGTVIPNGYVLVESGKIREVGPYGRNLSVPENLPVHDHGPGALIPALVNAHTHLELSCFKGKTSFEKGFGQWVQALLQLRENSSAAEMTAGAKTGLNELLSTGTGTICEISSLGLTERLVTDSGLRGLWCREVLGNTASEPDIGPDSPIGRVTVSLAGHAPHTTAPELLTHLKHVVETRRLPFPIHLAESIEETAFISSGRGAWADFLTSRGIVFSNWGLPSRSPVAYLERLGILDERTLAVHVLRADDADLDLLRQRRTSVCLCPRSNQALHDRLPDIPAMLSRGMRPCLGTDSLASTSSLDLFEEMAFVAAHYKSIEPAQILQMATINGADALLQPGVGTIEPGFDARMVYVPVNGTDDRQVMEAVVNKDFNAPCKPLFQEVCAANR